MQKTNTLNQLRFCAVTFFILFASKAFAQTEISLKKGEKIKKENNLYGLYYNKAWTVPCKYEKLEAYGWSYLFAYAGNEVDVYWNALEKELRQGKLPIKYVDLYKSFANKGNDVIYSQGKFGFYNKIYRIEPQYDSIYVICLEGSSDNKDNWSCDGVVGVVKDGKLGAVKKDGTVIALHADYISCRSRFISGANSRFELVATHKSGVEVIYDLYKKNDFIIITDKNNLKGYVSYGNFIEPKYTAIRPSYYPITDYECTLPDGKIEYRKGVAIVTEEEVTAYREQLAKKVELIRQEEQKTQKWKDYAAKAGLTEVIKTKTHTLNLYPGWRGIYKNTEKQDWLLSSSIDKQQPADVFNEAPDGWLKDESYIPSMTIKFANAKNSTLEKNKQRFLDLAIRRSGLPREKIKIIEEQLALADGRKGIVLFYVCADAKGMVGGGGNYLDCDLSFVSEKSPTTITSYTFFMEGVPALPQKDAVAWRDYFKKVLVSIRPN